MSAATIESKLLRNFVATHEDAIARADRLVTGLSDASANWAPRPGSWSMAECIQHLSRSLDTYAEKMQPAIEKARREGRTGGEPYGKGTFLGRYLVAFLGKGPSAKAPAPRVFRPTTTDLEIGAVAEGFRTQVRTMTDLARAADGLKLGHIVFASPVSPLVRVSLAQAFEVHILHTPRHLDQAERVAQAEGFPGR
jgi:hypothetical protein